VSKKNQKLKIMRHKKFFCAVTAILTAVIFMAGCKKENMQQPAPPPVPELPRELVKLTYENSPATPYILKYDTKGRLTEYSNIYGSSKFDYTNNVFSATFINQNNFMYAEFHNGTLDNTGRLLEMDGVYHQANQPDSYTKYAFTYNATGYITKLTHTNLTSGNVSQDDYVYTNDNLTSDINTFNGQPNYRLDYTYYDDLPNKLTLDVHPEIINFYTDGLTGKRSKNLMKTEQNHNAQNLLVTSYLYTYDLDPLGYPVKLTLQGLIPNFTTSRTYEYNK
jgi:hypothetical protein